MEKRKSQRVSFRNTIRFGPHSPPEFTSLCEDLSHTGLGIKTYWAFEPGTALYLIIDDTSKRYKAEGVVVWSKRLGAGVVQPEKTGMGIKFTVFDKELIDFYEQNLKPRGKSARGV
jgi:hypothetical protein